MDRAQTPLGGARANATVRSVVATVPRAKDEAVLALQRAVGNRAVAAIVRASRSGGPSRVPRDPRAGPGLGRTLARFVGAEHEDLGNAISTQIDLGDGVRFTWGEVVAIAGDEYETVDQLLADARDPKRRFEIRAALENAGVKGPIPSALPAPSAEQAKAHELTYERLAFDNADHFPDSGRALGAWAHHHDRALQLGLTAGRPGYENIINEAYLTEAFGQHFLTDCYSGSHVRTPRAQIIDWYVKTWAPRAVPALLDSIQEEMIDRLTAEADPQTHIPHRFVRSDVEDQVHDSVNALAAKLGGIAGLQRWIALGIAGALSGTIHDTEGAAGVVVTSTDHPTPWIAYGDHRLTSSPISREQAVKAITAAKAHLDQAHAIGKQVAPDSAKKVRTIIQTQLEPFSGVVERFIPRPVEERPVPATSTTGLPKSANTPLPEWKWGGLSGAFADAVNDYVKRRVGTKLLDAVRTMPELDPRVNDAWWHARITVHPRAVVEDIVQRLMDAPLDEVARRIAWPARASVPKQAPSSPARSTAPVPARVH